MNTEVLKALDELVAKKEGLFLSSDGSSYTTAAGLFVSKVEHWKPTISWIIADPLIKKAGIKFKRPEDESGNIWIAYRGDVEASGETRLIAAMKCFVLL